MPKERLRSDLPYLRGYIEDQLARGPVRRGLPTAMGCLLLPVSFAVFYVCALFSWPIWAATLAGMASFPLFIALSGKLDARMRAPRNDDEARQMRLGGIVKRLNSEGPSKVRRNVVPLAGQILESCAKHRARVLAAMRSQPWEERSAEAHWDDVRTHAVQAANEAMEEAVVLCDPYIGRGFGRDRDDWREVVQDVLEARTLNAALDRVEHILKGVPDIEHVNRADLPPTLCPPYEVALKLKKLADEVESAAVQKARSFTATSTTRIDSALEQLSLIREAEKELDEEKPPLRQGT